MFFLIRLLHKQISRIENKKWSRVSTDNKVVIPLDPNYKYISPPQVPTKYFLSETDAVVQANYRILPTTNTTQSELSIDIHPNNPNILFAGSNGTPWPVSAYTGQEFIGAQILALAGQALIIRLHILELAIRAILLQ